MDYRQFQKWLSGIDPLGTAQRKALEALFSGGSQASASLAAVEASTEKNRRCPHCGTPGAASRGKARGVRRYQCKGCRKTFTAQAESEGVEAADKAELNARLRRILKAPPPGDQTSRSPDPDGLPGK